MTKKPFRFLVGVSLLGTVTLGGCANGGPTAQDINTTIQQIQQAAVATCSFLPTTATVANIIGAASGVGAETQLATTIATQICAAVTQKSAARRGGAAPTVNGVVVHGRFVN